ncbi:hypothetical protein F1559_000122 [Cyanidiococcus yangmingshanensis]|uniref:Kinesin motor domain-containing protein n=1 Tax=Cyanidiococcus yangmingshanensis TaxID=2690220 RepID=A0A7J7IL76_9RHOD|nr:hypothetical protein F1559_000122 [Cyanidiococcus yangmingshanensis]
MNRERVPTSRLRPPTPVITSLEGVGGLLLPTGATGASSAERENCAPANTKENHGVTVEQRRAEAKTPPVRPGTKIADLTTETAVTRTQNQSSNDPRFPPPSLPNMFASEQASSSQLSTFMEETRRRMEEQERRLHAMIRLQQQQVAGASAVTGYGRSQGATAAELEALHNMISSQKHLIDSLQLEKAQMVNAVQTERLAKQMVEREVAELKNCLQETERRTRQLEKALEEAHSRHNQLSEEEVTKLRALERDCVELEQALAAEKRQKQRDAEEKEAEIARVRRQLEEEAQESIRRAVQRERIENLRNRLAHTESDASALRDRVRHLETTLRETESRLVQFEQKYTHLESDLMAVRSELRVAEEANFRALLESREQTIRELEEQAREDERVRRELHNMVQELKGNIRVFCRIRPLLPEERQPTTENLFQPVARSCGRGLEVYAPVDTKKGRPRNDRPPFGADSAPASSASERPKWVFQFDRVFDAVSTQKQVFEEISQLVQSALDGYKVCIFAYGQTGSGKTFTMIGDHQNPGMIPLSVRQVFAHAAKLSEQGYTFSFEACFLEIYNEHIRDLLAKESVAAADSTEPNKFAIKVDRATGSTYVSDVRMVSVHEPADVERLLTISARNRMTASTQMNERSSRSHSVFRLYIRGENHEMQQKIHGLLNLIDLAGSERLARSGSEGERLRETQHINKSLSALGDVIAALANKEKHVPFRNSKLTYLLQDSLGGDSKTLMFVNISPTLDSFPESLCSLRFAAKVNACDIGTARRNQRVSFQDI